MDCSRQPCSSEVVRNFASGSMDLVDTEAGLTSLACTSRILQSASDPDDVRWLPGAQLNIAESALCVRDQDAPALLWAEEEAPDQIRALTLGELRLRAQRFAAALRAAGYTPGLLSHTPFTDAKL